MISCGHANSVGHGSHVDFHEICSQTMDIVAMIPRKPVYLSLLDGCESLQRKRASNTEGDFTRIFLHKSIPQKDMSDRDSSVRRIGADSDPTAIVDQLLSQATSSVDRAQIILDTLINASEAGYKCNEIVAIVHSKAEREQSWTYLGLTKEEFYTRIQYNTIVAPAVEAFRRTDARKKRCLEDIKKVWDEEWKAKADPAGTIIPHDSERTLGVIRRISRHATAEVFGVHRKKKISVRTPGHALRRPVRPVCP